MSTKSVAISTTTATADDAGATPGTLVMRDLAGGIAAGAIVGTALATSGTHAGTMVAKTASFTAAAATHYVCDATGGAITVTLPLASASTGIYYLFVKKDGTGNAITITGASGTATTSTQWASHKVFSDGTTWFSLA